MAIRISNMGDQDHPFGWVEGLELGNPPDDHCQMFGEFASVVGGTDLPPFTVFNVRDGDVEAFAARGYVLLLEG